MTEMDREFWEMVAEEEQKRLIEALEEDFELEARAEEALGYQQWVAQGYECF